MKDILALLLLLAAHSAAQLATSSKSGSLPADVGGVGSGSGGRSRSAILHTYMLTGRRNVRWETVPMNTYLDANGKSVNLSKSGGDCVDVMGKSRSSNEEYERPNGKFKYRCNNGAEEVVACIGSERTKKARIDVGQTLNVDGLWHKCEAFPNNSVVYTQENTCEYNGKEYHIGDEINAGFLRLNCLDNGYQTIGCVYVDENNNRVKLNPGEKKEVGQVTHVCEEKDDTIQYYAKGSGCTHKGKDYKEGDKFSQNHLHYECTNGLMTISGCYVDDKKELNVGQDIVEDHMVYRCYKSGGRVEYNEYACGYNGTPSCKPEPIPQTSEDTQIESAQSRGFGAFGVAKKVGDTSLKLELDKAMMG